MYWRDRSELFVIMPFMLVPLVLVLLVLVLLGLQRDLILNRALAHKPGRVLHVLHKRLEVTRPSKCQRLTIA